MKESLRLASPYSALFNRVATKDHFLGEVKVTKNTLITIYPALLHSLEIVYENAEEFKPERWLNKGVDFQRHPNAYMPFSQGPRACIG